MEKRIVKWLGEREHLSISAIERSAGIPAGLLAKAIKGNQAISAKHITKLVEVLKLYGYTEAEKKPKKRKFYCHDEFKGKERCNGFRQCDFCKQTFPK